MQRQIDTNINKEVVNSIKLTIQMEYSQPPIGKIPYSCTNKLNQIKRRHNDHYIQENDSKLPHKPNDQFTQKSQYQISSMASRDLSHTFLRNASISNSINGRRNEQEQNRTIIEEQNLLYDQEDISGQASTRILTSMEDNIINNGEESNQQELNEEEQIKLMISNVSDHDPLQITKKKISKKKSKMQIKQKKFQRFFNHEISQQDDQINQQKSINKSLKETNKFMEINQFKSNKLSRRQIEQILIEKVFQSIIIDNSKHFLVGMKCGRKIIVSQKNMSTFFPNKLSQFYEKLISKFNREYYVLSSKRVTKRD